LRQRTGLRSCAYEHPEHRRGAEGRNDGCTSGEQPSDGIDRQRRNVHELEHRNNRHNHHHPEHRYDDDHRHDDRRDDHYRSDDRRHDDDHDDRQRQRRLGPRWRRSALDGRELVTATAHRAGARRQGVVTSVAE
jgi:hypothetical protein